MAMNIYITKENEQALREYKGTMSGLVNTLLDSYRKQIAQGFGTLAEFGEKVVITQPLVISKKDLKGKFEPTVKLNKSVAWCKQHDMELEFCSMMHKGAK
jgi:hypothetical protein